MLIYTCRTPILAVDQDGLADPRQESTRVRGLNRFVPILLKQNLSWELYARISHAASLGELPGTYVTA